MVQGRPADDQTRPRAYPDRRLPMSSGVDFEPTSTGSGPPGDAPGCGGPGSGWTGAIWSTRTTDPAGRCRSWSRSRLDVAGCGRRLVGDVGPSRVAASLRRPGQRRRAPEVEAPSFRTAPGRPSRRRAHGERPGLPRAPPSVPAAGIASAGRRSAWSAGRAWLSEGSEAPEQARFSTPHSLLEYSLTRLRPGRARTRGARIRMSASSTGSSAPA